MLALHGPDRHARFDANRGERYRRDKLRADPPRRGAVSRAGVRHRGARRGPAHQEPADPKRPGGEGRGRAQRIVLTGTPMENSVLDLWSIFDFLMPGYLGTAQGFPRALRVAHREGERRQGPEAAGTAAAAVHAAPAQGGGGGGSAGEARAGVLLRTDARSAGRLSAGHRSQPQGSAGSRRARRAWPKAGWWCSPRCCGCGRCAAICAC